MSLTKEELKEYKGGLDKNFWDTLAENLLKAKSLGRRMGLAVRIYIRQNFCH